VDLVVASGGTESGDSFPSWLSSCFSILMAVKAYRDMAREEVSLSLKLLFLTTHSWHLDKARDYFRIKIIKAPPKLARMVEVERVARAINSNTVMIVGRFNFPHGIIDPLPALCSSLLKKNTDRNACGLLSCGIPRPAFMADKAVFPSHPDFVCLGSLPFQVLNYLLAVLS
jgi:hypothetical protein